jgi:oxygen tolerance protein BatD
MMPRFLFALVLSLAATLPAHAALRAWVDNPQVAPGETVRLTLAHDGQTNSRPDLAPLKQDFDIVGSSTSSQVQIVNGKVSSTTQLELSLSPKHGGPLTIPSISWDSDRSQALTLNVTSSGSGANNSSANTAPGRVFVETEVNPKSPYVQAAVHVTVRVYAAVPLSHADLEFADTDAALVRQVASDGVSTVEKNGMSYQVVTRQYLVFPQHSGEVSIPGPTLSGNIPDRSRALGLSDPFSGVFANSPFAGMLGTSKPIRIHADPIVLNVQPRPAGANASYWLPARTVSLQASWNPSSLEAHVGDPITVDLKLQADGLTAAQLPDLTTLLKLPSGLKAYPDQPNLKDATQGADVIGSRNQSVALIADQPGRFTLPELHLSWWDTRANQAREVTLPAQTLAIQPVPGSAPVAAQTQQPAAAAVATQNAPSTPSGASASGSGTKQPPPAGHSLKNESTWRWISLGFGLLWLATVAAWLTTRKGRSPPAAPVSSQETREAASASQARSAFHEACRTNDAPAARRNLLLWANARWRGPRIQGLSALAKLLDDPEIKRLLQGLDGACYAQAHWEGAALAKALPDLTLPERIPPSSRRELAPLYR